MTQAKRPPGNPGRFTFVEGGPVANRFQINDPRTTTLAQPLSVYGGLRYTFNAPPPPPPAEPLVRKY